MSKPNRLNRQAIKLIQSYQKTKSPIGSGHCKYYPTCSQYGLDAYTKFSFIKASLLTLWRILRCNPFSKGGFDPVPFTKKEKELQNKFQKLLSSPIGELVSNLIYHYQLYPESRKTDLLKMLYQAYYGPKHFFTESALDSIIQNIKQETSAINRPRQPYTILGNGLMRIDLGQRSKQEIKDIAKGFWETAKMRFIHDYSFEECLEMFQELINLKIIEIPSLFEENLTPPYSHSKEFKTLYDPHYRLLHVSTVPPYLIVNDLKTKIAELLQTQDQVILAIEGPAASGKSTLAQYLAAHLKATVISTDDFFLPPKLRTKKRLKNPAGNIHYERLLKEVLVPLKQGKLTTYKRFDCTENSFKEVNVTPNKIYIIEGVYSFHPVFQPFIDLLAYCEVDEETQKERLKARSTPEIYEAFLTKWLPLEKRYFPSQTFKFPGAFIIPQGFKVPDFTD